MGLELPFKGVHTVVSTDLKSNGRDFKILGATSSKARSPLIVVDQFS